MRRAILIAAALTAISAAAFDASPLLGWVLAKDDAGDWSPADLNPVAWYKGDGNATDSAGGYNGTWGGTAVYTNGVNGQAFRFSGGNYVTVADNAALRPATNLTVMAWVRREASQPGATSAFIGKHNNYKIQAPGTSDYRGVLYPGGTLTNVGNAFSVGAEWGHIALVYDGAQGRVYRNGELAASANMSGSNATAGSALGIGYDSFSAARYFNGDVDDVLIFDKVLSVGEIEQVYEWRQ